MSSEVYLVCDFESRLSAGQYLKKCANKAIYVSNHSVFHCHKTFAIHGLRIRGSHLTNHHYLARKSAEGCGLIMEACQKKSKFYD